MLYGSMLLFKGRCGFPNSASIFGFWCCVTYMFLNRTENLLLLVRYRIDFATYFRACCHFWSRAASDANDVNGWRGNIRVSEGLILSTVVKYMRFEVSCVCSWREDPCLGLVMFWWSCLRWLLCRPKIALIDNEVDLLLHVGALDSFLIL